MLARTCVTCVLLYLAYAVGVTTWDESSQALAGSEPEGLGVLIGAAGGALMMMLLAAAYSAARQFK
jgi:hypothetical protein